MKKIAWFVLTALAVAALVMAFLPVSAKAGTAEFPVGTYTTTITAEDVAKYGLPSPYPEILIGNWELTFSAEGRLVILNLTTGQFVEGNYMANPAVLIFEGKEIGALDCIPPGNAAYKWSMSGNTLTLTGASDRNERCWGRFIVSTSHPLEKKP